MTPHMALLFAAILFVANALSWALTCYWATQNLLAGDRRRARQRHTGRLEQTDQDEARATILMSACALAGVSCLFAGIHFLNKGWGGALLDGFLAKNFAGAGAYTGWYFATVIIGWALAAQTKGPDGKRLGMSRTFPS